jgi:transposase
MVREDTVRMSVKELKRVHVIRQVMVKAVRQREAGEMLGVSTRQVRRLIQRVRAEGDAGLGHRSRGRPSNRQRAPAQKAHVLRLYAQHYGDFGPTLAAEKLAERHGITLSAETLRGWLRQQGIKHFRQTPASPSGVAGPQDACGRPAADGWLAPCVVRGPGPDLCPDGVH